MLVLKVVFCHCYDNIISKIGFSIGFIKLRNAHYVETSATQDSKHSSCLVGNSTLSDTSTHVRNKMRKPCNAMR